jgi:carbon monoxide dehydrogenase subunit G
MSRYTFEVDIAAPRAQVFELWTNVDRMAEWIGGVKDVVDVSGPVDQAGTTYTVLFGSWAKSPTTVIAAERPSHFATRFGNTFLRGENESWFEDVSGRTRLRQEFRINGVLPRVVARIFATGSYMGSFRGELNHFKEICEREAAASAKIAE